MNVKTVLAAAAATLIYLSTSACGGSSAGPVSLEPEPGDSEAMKVAKERYTLLCSTCHGMGGKGDGAAATALAVKPRTLADQEWQKSVTDDHIFNIIKGGGAVVGKSPLMPGDPSLTADQAKAMVQIVRSFGG